MLSKFVKLIVVTLSLIGTAVFFQNCSPHSLSSNLTRQAGEARAFSAVSEAISFAATDCGVQRCLYVRPGAGGSGADWSSALGTLPNSLVRGTTYFLADGIYGGHTFNDANSGSTLITIKKAIPSDHGTSVGWSDSYGDGQATFENGLQFYTDYYVLDGARRNGDWYKGTLNEYGIRAANTRLDNGAGTGGDNLTFRYIDFHGGGRDSGQGDDVIYGLTGNSNLTFQYCALHDSDRTIFLTRNNWQNLVVDHSYLARNSSRPSMHGEMMSVYSSTNMTFSNNIIEDIEGTAVWAGIGDGSSSGWKIYGNVILHSAAYLANVGRISDHNFGLSGLIFVANDATNNNRGDNILFYNNTMVNIQGLYSGVIVQSGAGIEVRNNIWYDSVRTNNSFSGIMSHNWYFNTLADGDSSSTKQTCTSGCNILADITNRNFQLTAPTAAGMSFASPYNIDMDGVTRGSDGTYDRGAFEFGGTVTTPPSPTPSPTPSPSPLVAPTNLRLVSVSYNQVKIQYDYTGSGQTSFNINRKIGTSGSYALRDSVGSSILDYTDNSVTSSTQYCYTVQAVNSTSASSISNELCTTTMLSPTAPPALAGETLLGSLVPSIVGHRDGVEYELGMKFTSIVAGNINAIRFYKSPSETGAHTGKIYSASGSLLASVDFTGETASGWQQQNLSTPLSIAANTIYTVSVNTGNQYYVDTIGGMASQISSTNLRSVVGSNGVFGSIGAMPTSSWNDSNYFRDVVFVVNSTAPSPTSDMQAPMASITAPSNGASVATRSLVTITATATDNIGVTKVEFYVDGTLKCTDTTASYSCAFQVSRRAGRSYSLQVKAYDAAGNIGSSSIVRVVTR